LLIAIPATYLTSLIIYLEKKLSIALRTKLSKYSYDLYMKNQTYYGVSNLDSRLLNADQCLTEDIKMFSETLAHVHSQISKPILDIILNLWELSRLGTNDGNGNGIPSFIGATLVIQLTSNILRWFRPSNFYFFLKT
jgi:ATP-binding cassette, subfamily D (ALD), member 2